MKKIKMLFLLFLVLFAFDNNIVKAQGYSVDDFNLKSYWLTNHPTVSNVKLFRLMVAPWGSDTKKDYGFSWEKPFKTITGALDWVPKDLKGYECNILVSGGHYGNGIKPNHRFSNGRINFMWVGTYANTGSGWNAWIRAGAINPITTDSAAYVFDTTTTVNVVELNNDQDLVGFYWEFRAYDYVNSPHAYDHKWIFDGRIGTHTGGLMTVHAGLSKTWFIINSVGIVDFYLGTANYIGLNFSDWSDMYQVTLNKCYIYGGTGTASTGNSFWTSALTAMITNGSLTLTNCHFKGVKGVYFLSNGLSTNVNISGSTLDSGDVLTAGLYGNYQGNLTYNDECFTVSDASNLQHTILKYHGGSLLEKTFYVTPNYLFKQNELRFNNLDSTRTFDSNTDSVKVKVNLNGQDYWLKLTR